MRIQFNINRKKTLEAVLWVLNQRNEVNMYNLLKIFFHADVLSMNLHGRPITGDNYLAYQFGTVPENIYFGLIRNDPIYMELFEIDDIPINYDKRRYQLSTKRKADVEYLSISDIECLNKGIDEYIDLSFQEAKEKNHSHSAWKNAYRKSPNSVIDWYDLIEEQYLRDDLSGGWSELMVI